MNESNQLTVSTSNSPNRNNNNIQQQTITTNATSISTSAPTTNSVCCEFFIDTLNRFFKNVTIINETKQENINIISKKDDYRLNNNDSDKLSSSTTTTATTNQNSDLNDNLTNDKPVLFLENINYLNPLDVISFLNYCHIWQQKQCVCVFTSDDLIEKFHHFLHSIIAASIHVIKTIPESLNLADITTSSSNPTTTSSNENVSAKYWQLEHKEKLLIALVKIFTLNMPLYVTYKHLLFNHGRYNRIKECSCSKLSTDSISLLYLYCQTNTSSSATSRNQDNDNLPIELMRNVSHFIDLNGLCAIKTCFMNSTSDNLPLQIAHILFNVIVNVFMFTYDMIRIWLNSSVIEQKIQPIRSNAINFMCQLTDRDLRLVANKNTTELMYESFKELNTFNLSEKATTSTTSQSYLVNSTNRSNNLAFKLDKDGLSLAYKYLLCSTLTIRLCGIAQMNYQINAWSEFYSFQLNSYSSIDSADLNQLNGNKNELADWFIKNKIIEQLFGPNLHVEIIKRSQDIMNFLAFTNRINEKHFDLIWSSAQLKHCSKPIMDMLMSLHKHLNIKSIQYLSHLIANLDLNQHNEQTLLLSALLTKNLWFLMLDMGDKKESKRKMNTNLNINNNNNSGSSYENNNINNNNNVDMEAKRLNNKQKVKIKLIEYPSGGKDQFNNKSRNKDLKKLKTDQTKIVDDHGDGDENNKDANDDEENDNVDDETSDVNSNKLSNQSITSSNCSRVESENEDNDNNDDDNDDDDDDVTRTLIKKPKIIPQKTSLNSKNSMDWVLCDPDISIDDPIFCDFCILLWLR